MSDFYQEVTFKQYFFTSPSSLCSCVLIVYLSVSLFFVCVCLDYSRTSEQIFIKNFVGRTWPKEEVTKKEKSRSYFGYKIIMSFQGSHLMTLTST